MNSKIFLPKQNAPKPFRSSFGNEFSQKQTLPTEYGAPPNTYGAPPNTYPYPPAVNTLPVPKPPSPPSPPSPPIPAVHEVIEDTFYDDTTDPTVIAVANAKGRFRILEKENAHEHIVHPTLHDGHHEHYDHHNDFLEHYHHEYPTFEDIVYRYDDHGHLVRY